MSKHDDAWEKQPKYGSHNARSVLTEDDVRQMRLEYDNDMSIKDIAELFNVGTTTAFNVVHRRSWKHVK